MSRVAPIDVRGANTTIQTTIVPGAVTNAGYRQLEEGPGEPLQVRNDFGGSRASMRLRSLACFVQVSDLHVADVQSPARREFLDRLGDPDSPYAETYGRSRTYRAQESFNHHVIEAMSVAVQRLRGGPLTGAEISFAISTGDAVDNCQGNELESYIALLDGGRVVLPDSGDLSRNEGVGSLENYDVRYWHPDGTPSGEPDDLPRSLHGFPTIPGILDECRKPFVATGLGLPWYAVYGNHDALVGGIYAPSEELETLAVGSLKPIALNAPVDFKELLDNNEVGREFGALATLPLTTRLVPCDPARRFVGTSRWIAAHLASAGEPRGHGFDEYALATARAYYGFDVGEIRILVLDTVNRFGGWQGSLDDAQFRWLEDELVRGHGQFIDRSGDTVQADTSVNRLFVLFSHHPIGDLTNCYDPQQRVRHGSSDVAELLGRFPNVICWFNGHTHENGVMPVRSRETPVRGFWQVTCASHIDWPQQSRLIEIAVDESTGEIIIATSCIDHAGTVSPSIAELDDPLTIAGWSRQLSVNAWQSRQPILEPLGRGGARDRNVALKMPPPFRIGRTS